MIGLPDRIWSSCFAAVNEIEGLAVDPAALNSVSGFTV
jgi:hypothetical protein